MTTIASIQNMEVGEALPVGIRGTAADLQKIAGGTVTGTFILNGNTVEIAGLLFNAPDAEGFIGVVPFPGTALDAPGSLKGSVEVVKDGQVWSPQIIQFSCRVVAHP